MKMLAGSSRKTSRYKQFFNHGEVIAENVGTAMLSFNKAEKRFNVMDGRRGYSTLEDDREETALHENNNSTAALPCDRLPTPGSSPEVHPIDPKATRGRRKSTVCFFVCACVLVFALKMVFSLLKAHKSSQMPSPFYFVHEMVLNDLRIDSNMVTLTMPNSLGRALYFCAENTVVCSRTEGGGLIWKRALIHKIENIQCNDVACVAYGNNTVTALEPTQGGFMWTLRIKAQPHLMTTSWGSRIVVIHNEYIIIYRQDTGRAMTHIRIKNCARINRIQTVGARLAVLCQQGLNTTSASLYIIPKSVLLHITSQSQDKPIPADFAGFFKLPIRLVTYNDTVLYILHDRGVVSTLSITERKIEDILSTASENVKNLVPMNSTHTLIQTANELKIYTSRGIAWRKNIIGDDISDVRRLNHNLVLLKNTARRLAILDIISNTETCISSVSAQELIVVNGSDRIIFIASLREPNATTVETVYYH